MPRLCAALTVAVALAWPGAANAAVDVDAAMREARSYWAAQGYPGCDPSWSYGPVDPPQVAYVQRDTCSIVLDPETRTYPQANLCLLATHEYGHLVGLEHTDSGRFPVMAERGFYMTPLKFCWRWLAAKGGRLEDPDKVDAHRLKQRLNKQRRVVHLRRQLTRIMTVRRPDNPAG